MKTDLFQSCGHCWVFHICWHIECSTLTTTSFRIWNMPPQNIAFWHKDYFDLKKLVIDWCRKKSLSSLYLPKGRASISLAKIFPSVPGREEGLLSLEMKSGHKGKSTCYVKSLQSCLTLWDPMDYSFPGSSVYGIHQARILEWVAISSARGSSWPKD